MSALRRNARKDSGHCRWRVNVHRLSSTGRADAIDEAATAAAAAVRGSEVDYRCAATIDKTHHLRLLSLYYSYTIGVLSISDSNTGRCQLSLCTAITSIVDSETFFDSPLRGNFGPTNTTGSASP